MVRTTRANKLDQLDIWRTFKFFVAHNITTGEGGMVFFKDEILDSKVRSIREFGRSINPQKGIKNSPHLGEYDTKYAFETLGYNVRMTDFAYKQWA